MSLRMASVLFHATAIGLVTVSLGCGNGTRPPDASISPSPSPTPAPDTTFYTLSGVVFEATSNGNAPRGGVDVYCDRCGSTGHTWVSTGDNGVYVFSHVPNGDTPLVVRRAGYVVTNSRQVNADGSASTHVIVNGDTRFDIQIEAVGSWDY
jgi:hypothetical protein